MHKNIIARFRLSIKDHEKDDPAKSNVIERNIRTIIHLCAKATHVRGLQNRMSEETERRADVDLHIGLLTEHELTRVLQMLDAIQDKGVDPGEFQVDA